MARDIREVIAGFEEFQVSDLDMWDADTRGEERLGDLVQELFETPHPARAMDSLFRVMERLPDADLGAPGPLVHAIERLGGYEPRLAESVRRLPTPSSVWMVNRILNTLEPGARRSSLLALLQEASLHPQASEATRESIQRYLQHQASRSRE